jgi:hypothetical protein
MSEQKESRVERVLDELIEAAERVGLKVRREKLMREVGYRARGGRCRLRGDDMVIIDRDQAPHEQLEIVAEALKGRDLEAVYLSPAARRVLQAGAP